MRAWRLLLALALLAPSGLHAQGTGRLTGTVTNEQGQPVASASVMLKGTRIGTLTGVDGKYVLPGLPTGSQTVIATLLGYGDATQQVTLNAGQTVVANFQLSVKAVQLEGIVAVGYGTQQKRTVTGAVATVKASQIAEVPTFNAIKAIQGRVAGVDITNSGFKPGDGISIRIRGVRSISATNDPLYVVDGVPIAGGIGDFNPEDIVSVDILKDAAATAVYGSRGANGVVLITTKGAGTGGLKTQFSANVNWAGQRPYGLPVMMNNQQYLAALVAGALYEHSDTSARVVLETTQKYNAYINGQHTDWQKLIERTGQQRSFQLGMNGISGNTRFNLSGNYYDQTGTAVGLKFNRSTGSAAIDHTQGRLRLGLTGNYAHSLQNIAGGDGLWGAARQQTGFGLPYDSTGALITNPDGDALAYNPLKLVQGRISDIRRDRVFASAFGTFRLLDGVDLRVNFGPDYTQEQRGNFTGADVSFGGASFRTASMDTRTTFQYILDNMLQVNKDIGTKHHIDGTLLYGIQSNRQVRDTAGAQHTPYDEASYYAINQGDNQAAYSNLTLTALESYMGRAVYTFMDRYTISGAVRRDGASQLAAGHKWTTFPSVGLAWQLGDEPFMKSFDWLSSLKLRGSWGKTGNAAVNAYQTQGALSPGKLNFGSSGQIFYQPNAYNPTNPNLGWEKTTQTDAALEYGLFGNRITGSADWYRQDTRDLLMTRSLPGTSGYFQTLQNIGSTRNLGVELQLSSINLQSWHGLRWQTDLNWSSNSNKVTGLAFYSDTAVCPKAAPRCDANNGWFVGFPIKTGGSVDVFNSSGGFNGDQYRRQWYDYKFLGIWQQADSALAASYGSKPGQVRLQDTNGNGKIDALDKVLIGSTYPKWTGSIYNRFTWKNIDLSGLVAFRWGYTIYNPFVPGLSGRNGMIVSDYWTPSTPVNDNPAPNLRGLPPSYGGTRGYLDGSNWRIRNIQLGYTLPAELSGRFGASNARIYATATEPYVHFKYNYFDPETYMSGSPVYRTFQVGADVSF